MLDVVLQYQSLMDNLNNLIESSNYKKEHFIKVLGVSRGTFYNKLKKKSFTTQEMEKLTRILFPEKAKALEIKTALEESLNDSAEGRVKEHYLVMEETKKYLSK